MSEIKQLESFVSVVNLGSLSAAAREEGVVPAVIGRRLDGLENRLGVRLLVRTTRSIALTQEGSAFYEDCQRILQDLREAELAVTLGSARARGHLNLLAPASFGRLYVAPHVGAFQRQHPEISITLDLSDRIGDLARERIDCAIRVSELKDSSLVAVRLAEIRRVFVASPDYLARRGIPAAPSDLDRHDCLSLMGESQSRGWAFRMGEEVVNLKMRVHLECNDGLVLREWALQGLGVAWRPYWEVRDDLATGRLTEVLQNHAPPDGPVFAVVAQRKYMPSRVRIFIDYLRTAYSAKGYWD